MSQPSIGSISIVVPVYNEAPNLPQLCDRIWEVLESMHLASEVIFIDDGSADDSLELLREQIPHRPGMRVLSFRRNAGQTAAMQAGIDAARHQVIVPLDADLQNDPHDIPDLLAKLEQGWDVVSGWRKNRQDAALRRNFPSRMANRLISRISGVVLHDYGCSLKAYRAEVVKGVRLYGEMHRFLPIYASMQGAKVAEIPVRHHPRRAGESKYGLNRIVKVSLDLIVVAFLERYLTRPVYVFGTVGLFGFVLSACSFLFMLILKFGFETNFNRTPLPELTTLFAGLGVQSLLLGVLSELLMRTYFESQGRRPYEVNETFGSHDPQIAGTCPSGQANS
ncbi:MAG: glycosyltransferase [Phycisphaeraceae bacterium]|jgi:glycosyltransferase involved in cell wall biosynthesis|nr:MAG: glycosyltransferase [Phycisphaera sp. TMED24]RZO53448.1 MAG: glycosyltransferase [Phycisphaeraceae bacterium]